MPAFTDKIPFFTARNRFRPNGLCNQPRPPMDICILHIGHQDPNAPLEFPPSPQRFESAIAPHLPEATWDVRSAVAGDCPAVDDYDAYLITGGKFSVFDPYDWQDKLFDFILACRDRAKPLVGICYGHQAIALALGGQVERSSKGWGVGLMPVEMTARPPWMGGPDGTVMLHAMHQDQVTELPDEAELFLASDFCPLSGFHIGKTFLAIQQHPDFTPAINRRLIEKRRDRIGSVAEPALASLSGPDDTAVSAAWIADFLRFAVPN